MVKETYRKVDLIDYLKDKVKYPLGKLWGMKLNRLIHLFKKYRSNI